MTPERLFDILLGLSVLSWAVLGLWHAAPDDRLSVPMVGVVALHLTVGVLFLGRGPERARGGPRELVLALPSLLASGIALKLAPPPGQWPFFMSLFFGAGVLWTVVSLATLGRSFAVLPSLRETVTDGPYALIRHPAYLGEAFLVQVAGAASREPLVQILCVATVPLLALRILAEERVLMEDSAWVDYARRVRWRLVPGLF